MRKTSTFTCMQASRVFFRIWNMGCVLTNPWGSLPFPSLLPFPPPSPSPLSLLFPEAGGVLCESWGINFPEEVWETPYRRRT